MSCAMHRMRTVMPNSPNYSTCNVRRREFRDYGISSYVASSRAGVPFAAVPVESVPSQQRAQIKNTSFLGGKPKAFHASTRHGKTTPRKKLEVCAAAPAAEFDRSQAVFGWDALIKEHVGSWHGIWTEYSPDGNELSSERVITDIKQAEDDSGFEVVDHKVRFLDRKDNNVVDLGRYDEGNMHYKYIGHACALGALKDGMFELEGGLTFKDWRTRVILKYSGTDSMLQKVVIVREKRDAFPTEADTTLYRLGAVDLSGEWTGVRLEDWLTNNEELYRKQSFEMNCNDFVCCDPVQCITWNFTAAQKAANDHVILELPGGIVLSAPRKVAHDKADSFQLSWKPAAKAGKNEPELVRMEGHFSSPDALKKGTYFADFIRADSLRRA
eukprot:jgi/Mesvir1/20895/Mv07969-RA.1